MEHHNFFKKLSQIDVNQHTEKKNGLTYLSWAWAWQIVKTEYPESYYTIYENENGWNYFTDGKTCWVKTGFTLVYYEEDNTRKELECIEYLPVMDFKNKSIPADSVTSFDVNKAIQRSLTKAISRAGLGGYIYAGEDLPAESDEDKEAKAAEREKIEKLRNDISAELSRVGEKMTSDEKKEFSSKHIKPVIGTGTYKTCSDVNKLMTLYNNLKKM